MRSLEINKDSTLAVLDGPSVIGVEHAVFPANQPLFSQTQIRFKVSEIQHADDDMIVKFDSELLGSLHTHHLIGQIIGAMRIDSSNSYDLDKYILWISGGYTNKPGAPTKFVFEYSIKTRSGCGRVIPEFPGFTT